MTYAESMTTYPLITTCFNGQPSVYVAQPLQQSTTCTCADRNELQPIAFSTQRDHTGVTRTTWCACHTCGGQEVWAHKILPDGALLPLAGPGAGVRVDP